MKPTALVTVLLTASLSVACARTPQPNAAEAAPIVVTTARAEVTALAVPFDAGGIVRARSTAVIASRMMAPIAAVMVRPGDHVRRGAELVRLDAREIQSGKARASAALLSATEAARAADADTRAAESGLVLARATHDRISQLQARRSATPQELDQAVAALAAADAQRASAEARAAAANAARDAAGAEAASADIAASYAVLSAPFDGIVSERAVDPGSMAMPGMALVTIEDPSTLRLEVQIDEARAALVVPSQKVDVRLDDASDTGSVAASDASSGPAALERWLQGRVVEIARVDPVSHGFVVKIDLPAGTASSSGRYGHARFAGPARQTLTVPTGAVIRRGQLTFAFAVDSDSRAHLRPISCGLIDRGRVEVLSGLHSGDVVVVSPPATLSDGARIARSER